MDSINNNSFDNLEEVRLEVADRFMSMLDEDGQPMFNKDWIERNILGITENPE